LIPVEREIHRMLGESNIVPKLRYSTRNSNTGAEANNQSRAEEWHGVEKYSVGTM